MRVKVSARRSAEPIRAWYSVGVEVGGRESVCELHKTERSNALKDDATPSYTSYSTYRLILSPVSAGLSGRRGSGRIAEWK